MSLKDHEITMVGQWLARKAVKGACAACGARDFGLSDIVGLPVLDEATRPDGNEYVPAVVAVCGNCGFIMPFSARMIGLR